MQKVDLHFFLTLRLASLLLFVVGFVAMRAVVTGGAKFSLRAEISTMARTVQNNLIENISSKEAQQKI